MEQGAMYPMHGDVDVGAHLPSTAGSFLVTEEIFFRPPLPTPPSPSCNAFPSPIETSEPSPEGTAEAGTGAVSTPSPPAFTEPAVAAAAAAAEAAAAVAAAAEAAVAAAAAAVVLSSMFVAVMSELDKPADGKKKRRKSEHRLPPHYLYALGNTYS